MKDQFFCEGRDAWGENIDREDCPYESGSDGEFGWLMGWDTAQGYWELQRQSKALEMVG